jgi:hypothetical protein
VRLGQDLPAKSLLDVLCSGGDAGFRVDVNLNELNSPGQVAAFDVLDGGFALL